MHRIIERLLLINLCADPGVQLLRSGNLCSHFVNLKCVDMCHITCIQYISVGLVNCKCSCEYCMRHVFSKVFSYTVLEPVRFYRLPFYQVRGFPFAASSVSHPEGERKSPSNEISKILKQGFNLSFPIVKCLYCFL